MNEQYLHSLFFVFTASIVDAISYSIFLPYFTFSILEAISCSILAKISRLLNLKQEERPDDTSQNQGKNRRRTVSSSTYLSICPFIFLSIHLFYPSIYLYTQLFFVPRIYVCGDKNITIHQFVYLNICVLPCCFPNFIDKYSAVEFSHCQLSRSSN